MTEVLWKTQQCFLGTLKTEPPSSPVIPPLGVYTQQNGKQRYKDLFLPVMSTCLQSENGYGFQTTWLFYQDKIPLLRSLKNFLNSCLPSRALIQLYQLQFYCWKIHFFFYCFTVTSLCFRTASRKWGRLQFLLRFIVSVGDTSAA